MRLAIRTPIQTPMGARGNKTKDVAKLRMSSNPNHA